MQEASTQAKVTIAVLSEAYLQAAYLNARCPSGHKKASLSESLVNPADPEEP
jgi:hypothetical protein